MIKIPTRCRKCSETRTASRGAWGCRCGPPPKVTEYRDRIEAPCRLCGDLLTANPLPGASQWRTCRCGYIQAMARSIEIVVGVGEI